MAARRPPLGEAAVLGYAGRLDREKGVFVLLDAAARLAARGPLKLLIAGDGPDAAALKTRSAELGLDVRFTGHLGRAEMEAALAPAWVQVVPSLWEEPFGNVTTEAMMRGTAVVASNGGGQAEIVKDGVTGRLVPPGNAEALAGALSPYTKDRALAEAHGEAGRQRAIDAFSDQATQRRYLALYEDLLA
nr:glycosyltransferase family 4 protein [Parvularcula dongshanensis]